MCTKSPSGDSSRATAASVDALLLVMKQLRDRTTGCPWDREQTFATIAPYTVEEAYEVAQAISDGDMNNLKEELGDLLFQVVFHAQMASERGEFGFGDVAVGITEKMIRRHPHVFADAKVATVAAQVEAWEVQKHWEREDGAKASGKVPSALDGVPLAFPALLRALKLQKRAARVGFDWTDASGPLDKLSEELEELRSAMKSGEAAAVADELGDMLFSWVNLARFLDVDPESALREANRKFERRFRRIEDLLAADGRKTADQPLAELERLWLQAKAEEPGRGPQS